MRAISDTVGERRDEESPGREIDPSLSANRKTNISVGKKKTFFSNNYRRENRPDERRVEYKEIRGYKKIKNVPRPT